MKPVQVFIRTPGAAVHAILHTRVRAPSYLEIAGASDAVGPGLDERKPVAQRVAKAMRNGIWQTPVLRRQLA